MAVKGNKSGWHILVRLLGATGLFAAGVGLSAWAATSEQWAMIVAIVGAALVALALLVEVKGLVELLVSRRGAMGFNVFVQIVLAVALLGIVNAFAFFNYLRFDWTRDREFTIPADIRDQLSKLSGETRIILFQRHTSFGQLADKQDNYDAAAERQIVAKVKDLVEQFQELGAQFRVEMLDIQQEGFEDKLAELKSETPALGKAIEQAPENSIFFYANDKVQRLGFHDIYELDKIASQQANDGQGNLVLVYQGIGPFARAALNIDARKPRVAVAVIAEILGLNSNEPSYGMAGAGKALKAHGFLTRDIILRKWSEMAPPQPAALTYDEGRYERLEEQLTQMDENIKEIQEGLVESEADRKFWAETPLDKLNQKYTIVITAGGVGVFAPVAKVEEAKKAGRKLLTVAINDKHKAQFLENNDLEIKNLRSVLKAQRQERTELLEEKSKLKVENLDEQRRITDLRAKMTRLLADCDLLVLPRQTLYNVTESFRNIPNRVHRLDDAQWQAIKDFMAAGKPVLFCLGPENEPAEQFDPRDLQERDPVEPALARLGFRLPKQTILFTAESKALAERRSGFLLLGAPVELPPVLFRWPPGISQGRPSAGTVELEPNPVRVSLELAARSVGKDQLIDLRLRHPRPVYFEPPDNQKLKIDPVFMMTSPEAWNESQPFPNARTKYVPSYDPKKKDPDKGTIRERRMGYFPIGVAVNAQLPVDWQASAQGGTASKVRLAVIGHGGVFMGTELTPAKEKTLLDVCNWLLGRDDLLARNNQTWEFPRVLLTPQENRLWQWGTRLWEPALFAFLGLVVWMVRRMR